MVIIFFASLSFSQQINDNNVRMRDVPFLTSNIMKLLNKGDRIEIFRETDFSQYIDGEQNKWYFVRCKDSYGWVFGKYISNINLNKNEKYISKYVKNITTRFNEGKILPNDICYFDYDFNNKQFLTVSQTGVKEVINQNIKERIKVAFSDQVVVWFDPVDIRDENGTAVYSDLIIRTPSSKIIIFPEKYNFKCYWDEVGFLKLTRNNKYLVIDNGTWHVRNLSILDLMTFDIVGTGSSVTSIKYNGNTNIVKFITEPHIEHGIINASLYADKNNISSDIDGENLKNIFAISENKKNEVSFYFGNLYIFDANTGVVNNEGSFLFYISFE